MMQTPIRSRSTPRWLYWLVQAACAYLLFFEAIGIVDVLSHREELAQMVPGGYGARLFMRPFVFSGLVLYAWIRLFRREREGARLAALLAAITLGLSALVMWLNGLVSDMHYPTWLTLGYPLAALVFMVYVVRGRDGRP